MQLLPPDGAKSASPELVIDPASKDLGGFRVRRALPSIQRRLVGPFVFLDHMGPAVFQPGQGLDVRPHPHIGLSTLTYLVDGAILHRDTLGNEQSIIPGDVNWMTAGRGIAHSERTEAGIRAAGGSVTAVQSWLALPLPHEETDPSFFHHPGRTLPVLTDRGVQVHVAVGEAYGVVSPVATFSDTLYLDVMLDAGAAISIPQNYAERAAYALEGEIEIAGESFAQHKLLVFRPGDEIVIRAVVPSRLVVLGGEPLEGKRHLWWNFVSSRQERIEQAKQDWRDGKFGLVPGDEFERIPLPE
jgi:redox-sensitive bicupin YhaK (pirin superfamily)